MTTGVLLATFGSAVTADDVPAYLASVRGGGEPPPALVAEFRRRYASIGRSPLIDITLAQAGALQRELEAAGRGGFVVRAGMLHLSPSLGHSLDQLAAAGATRVVVVVLAPQYSPIILAGYERAVAAWRDRHPGIEVGMAGAWHLVDGWIDSLAERTRARLTRLGAAGGEVPVVFTAHSLPRRVVERDPGYIDQLHQTARAVALRLGLPEQRWGFAYQSAGHTPEEWLTPDVKDLLPGLRERGVRDLLVVPLQFVADHLEILFDIDVAAVQEAAALGISLHRIELPNTSPTFIRTLAAVVTRELAATPR